MHWLAYCPCSMRPMQCTLRSLSPIHVPATFPLVCADINIIYLLLERTSGLFVQLVTFSEVSIVTMAKVGCIKSKRLCAASQTHFLISTKTATARMSRARLSALGLADAGETIITLLESINQAATSCTVLSGCFAAR